MTTLIFTEFLSVLGASTGVHGRKTLFIVGKCATPLHDMSICIECKIIILTTKLHKHDTFHLGST